MSQSVRGSSQVTDGATKEAYTVKQVKQSKLIKRDGQIITVFLVKWETGKDSWEQMELLCHCPLVFADFEKRERSKTIRNLGSLKNNEQVMASVGTFPPIPDGIIKTFRDPTEFIPTGRETIHRIFSESTTEDNNTFFKVKFMSSPGYYFIRKCIMEYLFPEASAYFHMQMNEKRKNQMNVVQNNVL